MGRIHGGKSSKTMTYLEQYRNEIRNGNIIAGRELITALDMYVEQMKDPRFIYDTRDADIRIQFMERFVKLTKSPYYGKTIKLMLFQKAFIECLYSFKWADTGKDRFKKAILVIARKNTKSETCNALGFTELMLSQPGSDIVCSSNDDVQANILFDGINSMREQFDPKNKRTAKNLSFIKNKKTNTKVFKLSDKTRNKEGRNIDWAVIDEVHEMKDKTIINSIDQSMSIKINPKRIIITTEGFVRDGALDDELTYARKILSGEYEDYTQLIWLYTQDSESEIWQDEQSWQKSNPAIGIVKTYDYLRDRLNIAKISKSERVFTLCKDFNIRQATNESWLLPDDYIYNTGKINFEDFSYCWGIASVDLSETTDLTCCHIMIMLPDNKTKYILSHYWIPENKLAAADDSQAGAKYKEWAREGFLTICEGSDNDLTMVADWIFSLWKNYNIRIFKCGYDQRFAKTFLTRMEDYNIDCEMIYQNANVMGNPMRLVEADLKNQDINYGENPITRWCLANACVQVDNLGRPMCVKIANQPGARIDGAVNMIILYAAYWRFKGEYMRLAEGNERNGTA